MANAFSNLSPEVQAALLGGGLQAGGALVSGIAQGKQNAQDNATRRSQLLLSESQGNQDLDLQRQKQGLAATQMDPLAQQKSRQQQALLSAIMGNVRNPSTSLSNGVPTRSGGIMSAIPEGGFSPETMAFFSPESRANAEGDFMKANAPFANPGDLSKLGYGQAGTAPTAEAQGARDSFLQDDDAKRQASHQALMQVINQEEAQTGKPSKWRKFLKYAGIAAGVGAMFVPGGQGVGMGLLHAGLAAGGAAAVAAGNGASAGQAMGAGALGALPSAVGAARGPAPSTPPFVGDKPAMGGALVGGGQPSQPMGNLYPAVPSYLRDPNFGRTLPGPMNPAPSPYGTAPIRG